MTTKPKQQATHQQPPDPWAAGANLDLSGFPQLSDSLANDNSDPFLGEDTHLVAEHRHSLKDGIVKLANARDAEVQSHLKRLGIDDPTASRDFFLASGLQATAHLGTDNVWRVTIFFEDGSQKTHKFPTAKTREQAQMQAAQHFADNKTVQIKPLSPSDELYIIRLCQLRRIQDAISNYLFARCGALDFDPVDDPRFTPVSNDCCWFVFEHTTPTFSEEARVWMQNFLANRKILNLDLLKAAFDAYETEHARAGLSLLPRQPVEPTPEQIDLDSLSDDEVEKLKTESLKAYAKGRR